MAMIDSSNIIDYSSRPRRLQQSPGKNYDGEGERNLELRGILDVLSAYKGYDGGINCSMCGKLYKSKVCFIKHLWEHSVYWDLFPGDKNHERVLAIQAALILYSHYLGVSPEDSDRLRDLLVTSPSAHEGQATTSTTTHTTPKKQTCRTRPYPVTPSKDQSPDSHTHGDRPMPQCPTTPLRSLLLEPPALELALPTTPMKGHHHDTHPAPYPQTPPRALEPLYMCPPTPRKDKRKSSLMKLQRTARRKRRLLLE